MGNKTDIYQIIKKQKYICFFISHFIKGHKMWRIIFNLNLTALDLFLCFLWWWSPDFHWFSESYRESSESIQNINMSASLKETWIWQGMNTFDLNWTFKNKLINKSRRWFYRLSSEKRQNVSTVLQVITLDHNRVGFFFVRVSLIKIVHVGKFLTEIKPQAATGSSWSDL